MFCARLVIEMERCPITRIYDNFVGQIQLNWIKTGPKWFNCSLNVRHTKENKLCFLPRLELDIASLSSCCTQHRRGRSSDSASDADYCNASPHSPRLIYFWILFSSLPPIKLNKCTLCHDSTLSWSWSLSPTNLDLFSSQFKIKL